MYRPHFPHPPVSQRLGRFYLLAVVTNAAMNMGVQNLFKSLLSILLDPYLEQLAFYAGSCRVGRSSPGRESGQGLVLGGGIGLCVQKLGGLHARGQCVLCLDPA